jgi:hypothetical protein
MIKNKFIKNQNFFIYFLINKYNTPSSEVFIIYVIEKIIRLIYLNILHFRSTIFGFFKHDLISFKNISHRVNFVRTSVFYGLNWGIVQNILHFCIFLKIFLFPIPYLRILLHSFNNFGISGIQIILISNLFRVITVIQDISE